MDSNKLPFFIKMPLNLIERELAPTLVIATMLVAVGCFYLFQAALLFLALGSSLGLYCSYKQKAFGFVNVLRTFLFLLTVMLFMTLMVDDHVFEDSTLPQIVEQHMTSAALFRRGH